MRGDIGERERHGETKQEIARIDAATAVAETERKQQKAMAEAELAKRTAELDQQIQIAQIQAKRAAEMEDAVLKKVSCQRLISFYLTFRLTICLI